MSLSLNCQFSVWSVKISKTNQFVVTKNPKHHHFYLHTYSKIYAHVHFFKLQYTWSKQSEGQWENLMIQQRTKSKFTLKFNSNKQMHKNLRTSGHRQIQQLFLTITLQEKNQYYLCHAHPNHKYSSVWLRTGGCHVDSGLVRRSEVKRTIVTEPSLSSNPVYQMQTFYIHIYFILFKVAHYTGKYFLKSVTWLW